MDTDSFVIQIITEDFYKDIANDIKIWFHTSQQTFVLMKTSRRRLEDVFRLQKTTSRRRQDVLIKTNMFALALSLQDVLVNTNIFVLAICLQDVFKTSSGRLQDIFKTF